MRKTVNNYGKNPVVMIEYRKKAQECEGPVSKWQQDVLISGERKGKCFYEPIKNQHTGSGTAYRRTAVQGSGASYCRQSAGTLSGGSSAFVFEAVSRADLRKVRALPDRARAAAKPPGAGSGRDGDDGYAGSDRRDREQHHGFRRLRHRF